MFDIAQNLDVRDVDMRVIAVLTLAIILNELATAYELIVLLTSGISWAFLTTPDSKEIINDCIYKFEDYVSPITTSKLWRIYLRPIIYLTFIASIAVLIII